MQPLRVSISCYDEMLQQLESGQVFNTWIECENTSGFPATSRHRDKHARDAGTHMLPMEDAPSTAPELAPLPVRPTVVSKKPRYPPDSEEIKALSAEIEKQKSWTTLMASSDEYDPIGVISEAMANSAASDAAMNRGIRRGYPLKVRRGQEMRCLNFTLKSFSQGTT